MDDSVFAVHVRQEDVGEIWADIPGFVGYQVSNKGKVRSLDRTIWRKREGGLTAFRMTGKELKQIWSGKYLTVSMKTDRYENRSQRPEAVHRLMLLAFYGPAPVGHVGCHIDDDKSNNDIENLYWGTVSQNNFDRVRNA